MSLSFEILIALGIAVVLSLALMVHLQIRNRSQARGDTARTHVYPVDLESEMAAELREADEAREQSSVPGGTPQPIERS